jgi:hypothetical protein
MLSFTIKTTPYDGEIEGLSKLGSGNKTRVRNNDNKT